LIELVLARVVILSIQTLLQSILCLQQIRDELVFIYLHLLSDLDLVLGHGFPGLDPPFL